jgi:S-adenosyl-L-methionine hydrolase (adenosine-forming)
MARFVTFLSDFGLEDEFVGTCHGVIKRIAPEVQIVDITHGIPPQNVLHGALVLAKTLEYMPLGVHLAVVDPGVGSARRPVALEDGEGRLYVGPDNGLLVPAAEAGGGIAAVHELANPRYALQPVSRTFHGRDLFAPAAAHLALGVPLAELGPPLDPDVLVRITVPEAEVSSARIGATALAVDRFGNVELNVASEALDEVGGEPGTRVALDLPAGRRSAVVARTFADASPGDLVVFVDSFGNVSLAVSGGSAAAALGLRSGEQVWIEVDSR